jgi:hypothetical protein
MSTAAVEPNRVFHVRRPLLYCCLFILCRAILSTMFHHQYLYVVQFILQQTLCRANNSRPNQRGLRCRGPRAVAAWRIPRTPRDSCRRSWSWSWSWYGPRCAAWTNKAYRGRAPPTCEAAPCGEARVLVDQAQARCCRPGGPCGCGDRPGPP